jgi:recombination protein RecA
LGNISAAKQKAVQLAKDQIERQFGKGYIMQLGGRMLADIPVISTGSLALDHALGVGGIPRGRVTEIFGPESGGKTLALHIMAEAQKRGGLATFIDAEHALDVMYAKKLGVKCDDLLVSQPDTGEQALEIAEVLVRSGTMDVVVIDSVAALAPKAEIEGDMGDIHMGLQARLMSQALRKLTSCIGNSMTAVIFINQIRMKIGVRKTGNIKEGEEVVGSRTRVRVVKNKVAPPFKEAEFDIIYGEGISTVGDLFDMAVKTEVINKNGGWYSFNDEKIGHGRESTKTFLKDHHGISESVVEKLRDALLSVKKASREPEAVLADLKKDISIAEKVRANALS